MHIKIEIDANSVEELKHELAEFLKGMDATLEVSALPKDAVIELVEKSPQVEKAPVSRKKTERSPIERGPATPEEETYKTQVPPVKEEPKENQTIAQSTDPLAQTSSDPLSGGTTTMVIDPLAGNPVRNDNLDRQPATNGQAAGVTAGKKEPISKMDLRNKISTKSEKRQQVFDLIGSYQRDNGAACEGISDIQEKDYESFSLALDKI